jgi:hypothetical protein
MPQRPVVLLLLALLVATIGPTFAVPHARAAGNAWPDEWLADTAFYHTWSRADEPVAARTAVRSWLWGPAPFAVANEPYAESPTGKRLVEYLDKARMEVNDPSADRSSPWFVSSGLLVYEMVTGQVQTGNTRFEKHDPANVPVAGDPGSQGAPLYSTFAALTGPTPYIGGQVANTRIARDGSTSQLPSEPDLALFTLVDYDDVSRHNIPAVFRDWMQQRGTVLENGSFVQGQVMDPLYTLGRPITEPYWVDIVAGGKPATVLVQLFERRALTYNPNNPPEWRVEMANVGRAYYDWRYAGRAPDPAIAAELGRDAMTVRGWNWPRGVSVTVRATLPGNPAPLASAQPTTANTNGRFSLSIQPTKELLGALQSGGNLQISAAAQGASAALPLAGKAIGGQVTLEGTITGVTNQPGSGASYSLRARDGSQWTVQLGPVASIRYAEGDPAPPAAIRAGAAVNISGNATGSTVTASEVWLLSTSRTGARLAYTILPGGKTFRVTGTAWPPSAQVSFDVAGLFSEGGPPLGRATTDSRGNLSAVLPLPSANSFPAQRAWLFASATRSDNLLAMVALPFDAPSTSAQTTPPRLFAVSQAGEQQGALGSYCWQGICADAIGLPVPAVPLSVRPGETLTFHSQYSPNPNAGLTPLSFTATVYNYDSPPNQTTRLDGTTYFTPKAQPVYTSTNPGGKPFTLTLPANLPPGKYALQLQITWPNPAGGKGDGTYGFAVALTSGR